MERQFLRIFYILFFLVGCQQIEINKSETTAKARNLNSFEYTPLKKDEDKSIWAYIQNNNNSKDNLDLLKLIENTLPYQEIFRLMSDGKEMMITWEDNEDESIKLIKKYILDLKESNIEKLIIVGLVQKFLQNSVLSLTTEQIIEML